MDTKYADTESGREVLTCQGCGNVNLLPVFNLGEMPICNRFLKKEEIKTEKFYPLNLVRCPRCSLVQLEEVPPHSEVFGSSFGLLSGQSRETVDYMRLLANQLIGIYGIDPGDYVLDIGSNDGTLLKFFMDRDINVLGVDPANDIVNLANRRGIQTLKGTFEDSLKEIRDIVRKKLKVITALRVMAHTDRIHEFLDGVNSLMHNGQDSCLFVSQSQYFPETMSSLQWDTIYHEHARYYSATSLSELFSRHGMKMFDAQKQNYNGGTILAFVNGRKELEYPELVTLRAQESIYWNQDVFDEFAFRSAQNAARIAHIVRGQSVNYPNVVPKGKTIAGIGAPMKSSTMLNYCHFDSHTIKYLADFSPLKVGTYSPGMHIPVVPEEYFFEDPPDYALLLAWQAKERIIQDYRERGYKGGFIIPSRLPELIR